MILNLFKSENSHEARSMLAYMTDVLRLDEYLFRMMKLIKMEKQSST